MEKMMISSVLPIAMTALAMLGGNLDEGRPNADVSELVRSGEVAKLRFGVVAIEAIPLNPKAMGKPTGGGTAIVVGVRPDGTVDLLSNEHVIRTAPGHRLEAVDANGSRSLVEVLASDGPADIAALRTTEPLDVRPVQFAEQHAPFPLASQCWVVGNSAGLGLAIHGGVIARYGAIDGTIHTDAAINPGNSGGALFGPDLSCLGIVTMRQEKVANKRIQGIGYVISAPVAKRFYDDLVEFGAVQPAYFGLKLARDTSGKHEHPVYVYEVIPGTAAAASAIRPGDRLIRVGEVPIRSLQGAFGLLVRRCPDGMPLTWVVERNGIRQEFELVAGSRANDPNWPAVVETKPKAETKKKP